MKRKVVIAISQVDKVLAQEWLVNGLIGSNIEFEFILYNEKDSILEKFLGDLGIRVYRISRKGIFRKIIAFIRTVLILLRVRPHVVHSHLRQSNVLAIPAAFIARIKKRIYTRHDSTFDHLYFPKAVRSNMMVNKLSTQIISICENVTQVLVDLEKVPKKKITKVYHGFDLDSFESISKDRIERSKEKYDLGSHEPIVGVVARYIDWKGIEYIIEAFSKILVKYPRAKLVLANAQGTYRHKIREKLKILSESQFVEIPFENDIQALYKCFNIYIHCPDDPTIEAFGQTYIEALASGIPSVFTLSGIAHEFIEDQKNAIVIPYKDPDSIEKAVIDLLVNPELRKNLIQNGKGSVKKFNLKDHIKSLRMIYEN